MNIIDTKYHGSLEIDDSEIIAFQHGIPGFVEEKHFVLIPFAEHTPFFILQSMATPSLAFVTADPFSFFPDYDFSLPDHVVEELMVESEKDVDVYVVLTVADPFEETTANLQAPLVIHHRKQKGKQIVLDGQDYGTKHLLVSPTSSAEQEA